MILTSRCAENYSRIIRIMGMIELRGVLNSCAMEEKYIAFVFC